LTFAERASAHAVRTEDPSILRRALLAIALACPKPLEPPSGYTELALCYRSAEILRLSPDTLFTAVPEWVSKGGRDWVAHFVTERREENRLIGAFDYQEGADGDGFRYVPKPRYKPARVHSTASDPTAGWSMSSDTAL